tara:strand:+ start:51 stop:470 length:420 start_codon:yes stop_codon:yes gene_type:complete
MIFFDENELPGGVSLVDVSSFPQEPYSMQQGRLARKLHDFWTNATVHSSSAAQSETSLQKQTRIDAHRQLDRMIRDASIDFNALYPLQNIFVVPGGDAATYVKLRANEALVRTNDLRDMCDAVELNVVGCGDVGLTGEP